MIQSCSSVARDAPVNFRRPAVDAARKVVEPGEALAGEDGADLRAADAVVAHDDGLARGVERAGPLLEAAERQQLRALDARQLELLRLAHVNQQQVVAAPPALRKLR